MHLRVRPQEENHTRYIGASIEGRKPSGESWVQTNGHWGITDLGKRTRFPVAMGPYCRYLYKTIRWVVDVAEGDCADLEKPAGKGRRGGVSDLRFGRN